MKKKVDSVYVWLAVAFFSVLALISCANPLQDSESSGTVDPRNLDLSYKDLATAGYMGGKILYAASSNGNGVDASISHLQKDVVIGVRTSQVKVESYATTGETGIFVENPEAPISYGYIKIEAVDPESVTFGYQRFSNMGGIPFSPETFTVRRGEEGVDINHDGALDISYEDMDIYRPGIGAESRYLNFISSQSRLNATFFSVLPEQYKGKNYPSGLVGINPEGKWLVNRYEVTQGVNIYGYTTDSEGAESPPQGTSNQVKGLVRGDYIIDNYQGYYYSFEGGDTPVFNFVSADTLIRDSTVLSGIETAGPTASVGFGGPSRAVNSISETLKQLATYKKGDMPIFMNDNDQTKQEFSTFKEKLGAIFQPAYADQLSAVSNIDTLVTFLNTAIEKPEFATYLKVEDPSAEKIPTPAAPSDAWMTVNRTLLQERLRETGLDKYILPARLGMGITDALPLSSVQMTDTFDDTYDPSQNLTRALEQLDRASPRAAVQGYQSYRDKQAAARQEFDNNFKQVIKKDVFNTIVPIIYGKLKTKYPNLPDKELYENLLDSIKTEITLGFAGGAKNTWGNVEMTIGAAVFLQMEIFFKMGIDIEDLLGEDGILLFQYSGVFQAGPVTLQITCPVTLNMDARIEAGTNLFAGYTGFYGGKATAGVNYGVSYTRVKVWPWPAKYLDIPNGVSANPYASGTAWKTTVAYFGPTDDGPITVNINATLTPRVIVTPGVGVYGILWGKLPAEVGIPLTASITQSVQTPVYTKFSLTGSLTFGLGFSVSAGVDILGYKIQKSLGPFTLFKSDPQPFLNLEYTFR
jgi:hypothetical protein